MLEALAALLESREIADETAIKIKPYKTAQSGTPRGDLSSCPPVQIHVHEDAKTGFQPLIHKDHIRWVPLTRLTGYT